MVSVIPLAITMGDPAGVGPEVLLRACAELAGELPLLAVAHRGVLARVAAKLSLPLPERIDDPCPELDAAAVVPGTIAALHGRMAAACIERAIAGCRDGTCAGMVTAPIHKQAIRAAGVPFPGHTEWLAARCSVSGEKMLLYADDFAVALATVHQPLMSVAASLTPALIADTGRLLAEALRRLRGRPPRLAVLGLNPHAGEGGLLGHEDAMVTVAVGELLQLGIDTDGPLPPDTAFTPANRARYDGFVCLYHDQGLIPFKALHFSDGVNITLGLPIIRTSVDHGTAFDRAWQGTADHRSLIEAIRLAARLAGMS